MKRNNSQYFNRKISPDFIVVNIPIQITCPITSQIMKKAGRLPCGHVFEFNFIFNFTMANACCPIDYKKYEFYQIEIDLQLEKQIQEQIDKQTMILKKYNSQKLQQKLNKYGGISGLIRAQLKGQKAILQGQISLAVQMGIITWAEYQIRFAIELCLQSMMAQKKSQEIDANQQNGKVLKNAENIFANSLKQSFPH